MKKHFSNFLHQLAEQHLHGLSGVMVLVLLLSGSPVFSQKPGITSFEPVKAFYGQTITIIGSDFAATGDLQVKFGGAKAKIIESTSTTIKVSVPAGATYAPITVTNLPSGLTAYTNQPFLLSFGGYEDGDLQFAPSISYPATGLYDVCACDLDGDGRNDLAGSNQSSNRITTYLNSSSISKVAFSGKKEFDVYRTTTHLSCGDLDGDGRADLVYSSKEKVVILRNTGTTGNVSFAAPQTLTVTSKILAKPAIQDLDGDGKPEIILTNQADKQVIVFRNISTVGSIGFDSNFLSFTVPEGSTQGLRIKDVDGNGLPDITASNYYGSKVAFLLNSSTPGNISFQAAVEFSASNLSNHELEDLDGDGKRDLITLDYYTNSAKVYLNNSTDAAISFSAAQAFPTGSGPYGLELGDFNGDKKTDVLIGHNLEAKAYLLINTSTEGNLSFNTFILSGAGKFTNVQASDFDGDAIPDVAIADKETGYFNIFRNTTCIYPGISPSGEVDFCNGASVTLSTVQSPKAEGSAPSLSYQWLKDGVVIDGSTEHTLTTSTAGNYVVKMTSAEESCSTTSNTVKVINFEESLAGTTFGSVTDACEGQPLTLSVSSTKEGATYTWTNDASGFEETTTTNSLTIAEADPALHAGTYTLTIAKSSCSIAFQSAEITIHPKPVVTLTADGDLSFCAGESRVLSTKEDFTTYQWKKDGNTIADASEASYAATEAGAYTVVVSTTNGCIVESEAGILEVEEDLQADFAAPAVACVNQPVQFTDQSTLAAGKTTTYLWDFGDGSQSTDQSPVHTYNQASSSPYTVSLQVTYEESTCSSTYTEAITIKMVPEVTIKTATGSTELCLGDSVKVQINGDVTAVNWSNGDTGLFTYAKEDGLLQAEVLTAAGCTLTKSVEISSLAGPALEITADKTTIGKGESVRLQASGGVSYTWEPAASLDNPNIAGPLASPAETTTYKVTATGARGCTAEAEITIEVDASFKVEAPKLFIPATDQNWTVSNIESYPEASLLIISKLGRTVFTASPYENNWNGRDQGNQLNEGVYFYVFKNASGKIVKTGSITIVR